MVDLQLMFNLAPLLFKCAQAPSLIAGGERS